MSGAAFNRGKSRQDYQTPWPFIHACEVKFGPLSVDLAATAANAKAPRFITPQNDSLTKKWSDLLGLLFLNPPFDRIGPWAEKCRRESEAGANILFLVPASVGSNWFLDNCHDHSFIYFLTPRISFDGIDPYPKDMVLCVFMRSICPGYAKWRWDDHSALI